MVRRTTSVTIIAVVQLVFGVLGLFAGVASLIPRSAAAEARRAERTAETQAKNPLPISIQRANSFATTAIALLCGYFLLQGKNWARWTYVIWESLNHLFYLYLGGTSPRIMQLLGLLIFILFVVLLFRPQANAFFAEGGACLDVQSKPSLRRIASFVCYVLSGVFFMGMCLMAFSVMQFGIVKCLVLCGGLLPAAVILSVGRVLSPARDRATEVGVVFLASAGSGALVMLTLCLNSEFQKAIVAKNPEASLDYLTGSLWIALLATFGRLSILASRRQAREKSVRAPIFGAQRRG